MHQEKPESEAPAHVSRSIFIAEVAAALTVAACSPAPEPFRDDDFLALSKTLTGHADLDPEISSRLMAAMTAVDPGLLPRLASLAHAVPAGADPKDALAKAKEAKLDDTALAIVSAWYTGATSTAATAQSVAYADALMFQPAIDAVPIQTLCDRGPGWWVAKPPDLGIPLRSADSP